MTFTGNTEAGSLPSHADVVGELLELRRFHGISSEKVRKVARNIMTLPVVDDQIRLGRLAAQDRFLATYQVLKCAVTRNELATVEHRVLRMSFNFDNLPIVLKDRLADLENELGRSANTIAVMEREAISDLATFLIGSARSPCAEKPERPDIERMLTFTLTMEASSFAVLLRHLPMDDRSLVREAIAEEAMRFVPLADRASRLMFGDDWAAPKRFLILAERVTEFVNMASETYSPRWIGGSGALLNGHEVSLTLTGLAAKQTEAAASYGFRVVPGFRSDDDRRRGYGNDEVRPFALAAARTMTELAHAILTIEGEVKLGRLTWAKVLQGEGGRERARVLEPVW